MYSADISNNQLEMYGHRLDRTSKMMKLFFSRALSDANIGVTVDQYVLLNILASNSPITQQELANYAYKDAPTITKILDILADKGLVVRVENTYDRRKFDISLTPKGAKTLDSAKMIVHDFRLKSYKDLSTTELEIFAHCLDKILFNLTNKKNIQWKH